MTPSSARVLVADDDEDILDLVRMVLEEDGYEVVGAGDGQAALDIALERPPDLCILDVMMPKLDGCELTRRLRARPETEAIPIILLSARTQWESVEEGRAAGANEYITKPFIPDDLQREVRGLISSPVAEEPEPAALELIGGSAVAAAVPAASPEPAAAVGLVLVGAADEHVINLIRYRLELGGYEVTAASDPSEALQLAAERPPDICVLDAGMPEIVGPPVVRVGAPLSIQELYREVEASLGGSGRRSASGSA
jgi:DNA-binding response OmpR family regulator